MRDIRDNKWKLTYQLNPLEMQEFSGSTVVVHYAAEYAYDYGDGTRSGIDIWRKFTHTWMRQMHKRLFSSSSDPRRLLCAGRAHHVAALAPVRRVWRMLASGRL